MKLTLIVNLDVGVKEDGTNAHESRTVKSVASIQFLGQERERHRGGAANDSRKQMKRPQQPAVALAPLAVILSLRFLSYFPSFFLFLFLPFFLFPPPPTPPPATAAAAATAVVNY